MDELVVHSTLEKIVKETKERYTDRGSPEAHLFFLAIRILEELMGRKWLVKNMLDTPGGFLDPGEDERLSQFKQELRVRQFAELLLNFQPAPGFRKRLGKWKTEPAEPVFAELQAAKLIIEACKQFEFVDPSGNKTEDFDFDVVTKFGKRVCVEVKCKLDQTCMTEKTLRKSLNKAKKQMPEDCQNSILIKLPESWVMDVGVMEVVSAAIGNVFRSSKREVSVAVFCDEFHTTIDGKFLYILKFNEVVNLRTEIMSGNRPVLYSTEYDRSGSPWIFLDNVWNELSVLV